MENSLKLEDRYERMGKFIYGSCRYGGDIADVYKWMADNLRIPNPDVGDTPAQERVQDAYFAKYIGDDEFYENHQLFMEMMRRRGI
jgi:hypothetical protein